MPAQGRRQRCSGCPGRRSAKPPDKELRHRMLRSHALRRRISTGVHQGDPGFTTALLFCELEGFRPDLSSVSAVLEDRGGGGGLVLSLYLSARLTPPHRERGRP